LGVLKTYGHHQQRSHEGPSCSTRYFRRWRGVSKRERKEREDEREPKRCGLVGIEWDDVRDEGRGRERE
jgi:hypothetical protein